MFLHKTPLILTKLFPGILWHQNRNDKIIYLTFDDGPVPEVTPWVLDQLKLFDAKATFFMVGGNIIKYHDTYDQVVQAGHSVGNHTMNHLNGWKTKNQEYYDNIDELEKLMGSHSKKLFRPPYGRIRFSQLGKLKQNHKVVMWDVLSGDFSSTLSGEKILDKCIRKTRAGSIIVFHDSPKMFNKLKFVLPKFMAHFHQLGFTFKAI